MPTDLTVVHVDQRLPRQWSGAVYLSGPTPTDPQVPSWRGEAVAALRKLWSGSGRLAVFVPEPSPGGDYPDYADQIAWEEEAMRLSDVVAFYIPRRMPRLPGLVSNIKWGAWHDSGRVVLGTPPEADRMEYLLHFAKELGVPVAHTIEDTARAALEMVGGGAPRQAGERAVPLLVWRSARFREWYAARTAVGDELLDARVEWYRHRPGARSDDWSLSVSVRRAGTDAAVDGRLDAERPDTRAILLHGDPDRARFRATTIVLAAHPATCMRLTDDGRALSLPTAPADADDASLVALIARWTGLQITPDRLRHGPAVQPDHASSPYRTAPVAVRLTVAELRHLRSAAGAEDPRFVVGSVADLHSEGASDWATLGLVTHGLLAAAD
ncbi:nucleoside 2-deoxyribosyltransferase domain-containing protein [Streptomyces sp. NPDC018045]|uniref:nucleoside 2-deoxyribosyltransferase domain-containing protein n=1 Tax=Streptomyces sp. NPDC018045 TaxID=3365037 RepID=UPI00379C6EE8